MHCARQRLLFLKATDDYSDSVVAHIRSVCDLVGVSVEVHDYTTLLDLEAYLRKERPFDMVYIAAHGAHHCFGENTGPIARWADFATVLCSTQALNADSILFMGCCHGGLKKVSLILFSLCDQISSICGPRWTVSLGEVPVALHVFLHNYITNRVEPELASECAAKALGIHFPYYNRYELEAEILVIRKFAVGQEVDYCTSYELEPAEPDSCCPTSPSIWGEEVSEADLGNT